MKAAISKVFSCLLLAVFLSVIADPAYADPIIQQKDAKELSGGWILNQGKWYWKLEDKSLLKNTMLLDGKFTYFLKEDGSMSTGWENIDNEWYYFYEFGGMHKNEFVKYGSWIYYLDENGVMATGWKEIDGKWYYFYEFGGMHKNEFVKYGSWTYYLDENGVMATGWKEINGKWYYFYEFGGMHKNEFAKYGSWTYYLDENGVMATGWKEVGGNWYYFYSFGGMYKNTLFKEGRWTYYVDENGVMATGWKQCDGKWYYFMSWGGAAVGTQTISVTPGGENKTLEYKFSENGALIGEVQDYLPKEDGEQEETGSEIKDLPWRRVHQLSDSIVYGEVIEVEEVDEDYRVLTVRVANTIAGTNLDEQEIRVRSYHYHVEIPDTMKSYSADELKAELLHYFEQAEVSENKFLNKEFSEPAKEMQLHNEDYSNMGVTISCDQLLHQNVVVCVYPDESCEYAKYTMPNNAGAEQWIEISDDVFYIGHSEYSAFNSKKVVHRMYYQTKEELFSTYARVYDSDIYNFGSTWHDYIK